MEHNEKDIIEFFSGNSDILGNVMNGYNCWKKMTKYLNENSKFKEYYNKANEEMMKCCIGDCYEVLKTALELMFEDLENYNNRIMELENKLKFTENTLLNIYYKYIIKFNLKNSILEGVNNMKYTIEFDTEDSFSINQGSENLKDIISYLIMGYNGWKDLSEYLDKNNFFKDYYEMARSEVINSGNSGYCTILIVALQYIFDELQDYKEEEHEIDDNKLMKENNELKNKIKNLEIKIKNYEGKFNFIQNLLSNFQQK